MKRIQMMLFAALIMLPQIVMAQNYGEAPELKVMSFNIRYGNASDGTNSWNLRYVATAEMIEDQKPDIIGLQEALSYQVLFIEENFKDYKCVGVGRENGKKEGEHMSIFWNKKTIKLLKWGTFWLSETPDTPSKGWGAGNYRDCTWILFKEKASGRMFYHFNTHLDHAVAKAQTEGAKLIRSRMNTINKDGLPMILTGDMNVAQDSPVCASFQMDNVRKSTEDTDSDVTCHGYGSKTQVIDHIFSHGFTAWYFQTVKGPWNGLTYISDHNPVMAELECK